MPMGAAEQTFDFVIVGAGTAGCLLANRLSADSNNRVLLIEAGGRDNYHWIHIPVGYLYCINNPRTDWLYRTEPTAGLNGRSLLYPRGKTLGGCSSINGMIYMRGQARDYDGWEALTGDEDWGWQACLADFKRHENHHRLDPGQPEDLEHQAFHSNGGEWRVEQQRLKWAVLDDFAKAAIQAGIPATDDFNRGCNEGVSYFEVNQRRGWRWNTSKAFLRGVASRPNLTVWHSTPVARLLIDKTDSGAWRCNGLVVERDGVQYKVKARAEVVLSAGAIGSPQLLQVSGIGPSEVLQPLGIEVKQPLHNYPAITASVCNLNPSSRGTVYIQSADARQAPKIAPNYLSTDEDRKVAADSLRVTRRIAAQPAFAHYDPVELKPSAQYESDDELAQVAGDIGTTIFHPVGTTRMGRDDDPDAVVNSRLCVRGVSGLRVVDAGIMPTITSGNTNSPTLMIAEKAAGWILQDLRQYHSSRSGVVGEKW